MSETQDALAIMFLELAGGAQLYNQLGDHQAKARLDACLSEITRLVESQRGIVIKSIGEGLMCRFDDANDSVNAACMIHEMMQGNSGSNDSPISASIGLNYGSVIQENRDVFGDAVNLAARVKSLARPGQALTTEALVTKLNASTSPPHRSIDRTQVKGRQEEITLYEILWQTHEITSFYSMQTSDSRDKVERVVFRYGSQEYEISRSVPDLLLGRDDECDISVKNLSVSRLHAHVHYRRDKFILLDHSTNGTSIKMQDSNSVHLLREEVPLWGRGIISLGKSYEDGDDDVIHFICY
ncbi:MAG: adenylate/guanylate cyclase domain-containing protein [Pseudomonadota bacterium]